MNMNYEEGIKYMQNLTSKLEPNQKSYFSRGQLKISYPGNKETGDYLLTINGVAPKHTDIVQEIYNTTTQKNVETVIRFLDDIYKNGLNAKPIAAFPEEFIEKVYWITLQEEINYPQTLDYQGRKLPFQRFYESALYKAKSRNITEIEKRTNNHGEDIPELFNIASYSIPSFYE